MQYKDRNLVVNFSNTYSKEIAESLGDTDWIDCSDISGTNMYCTDNAADEIKRRLEEYSPKGVHFIDSGNYHYMTEFFVEKLEGKFSLVLFDYHNDMQVPMIHSFTSCGDWAREVLENNDNLEQLILIGPSQKNIDDIDGISKEKFDKLVCISLRDLEEKVAEEKLELIKNDVPLYVSIDKDVLSKHYAKTNWSQGKMSVELLKKILKRFLVDHDIIGADICGERNPYEPMPKFFEDRGINKKTNKSLYDFLTRVIG
ncbi:arginase family protein [Peptacetobacter hiranonis]|uniref:arginase family protein n=1 Tax=Peptacetobacter hiranonis TaxID=89152 RepID=UPI002E777A71|nr:arginase family protein [Peptacetobacter hiranonis]MEE0248295.1 arginase family protein [Peptacetobacter hiranonis]